MIFRKKALLFVPFILLSLCVADALCQKAVGQSSARGEKARRYVSPELIGSGVTSGDPLPKTDPSPPATQMAIPDALRVCQAENECVDVPDTCASCNCGAAINREKYQDYFALKAQLCGPTPAIACEMACPGKKADCVRGYCTLVDTTEVRGSIIPPQDVERQ